MAKVHLADRDDAEHTRCGYPIASPSWSGGALPIAASVGEATCVLCLRALRDALESGEESEPFVAPPPTPARYGARDLTRTARRALEDACAPREPEERRWPTPEAAVRSYVRSRAEGASLRSTTDPDRANRVQSSRDPSLGGREHAAVDRHRTVAVALTRAMDSLAHELPHVPLAPRPALEAYVMAIVGDGRWQPCRTASGREVKSLTLTWIRRLPEDVARIIGERFGATLHEAHVEALIRHFTHHVREALRASGELATVLTEERVEPPRRPARVWDPMARLRASPAF
jgi:hypothetical protein